MIKTCYLLNSRDVAALQVQTPFWQRELSIHCWSKVQTCPGATLDMHTPFTFNCDNIQFGRIWRRPAKKPLVPPRPLCTSVHFLLLFILSYSMFSFKIFLFSKQLIANLMWTSGVSNILALTYQNLGDLASHILGTTALPIDLLKSRKCCLWSALIKRHISWPNAKLRQQRPSRLWVSLKLFFYNAGKPGTLTSTQLRC